MFNVSVGLVVLTGQINDRELKMLIYIQTLGKVMNSL